MPSELSTLKDLFRSRPGRSFALSFAPFALASVQSVNVLVHGLSSPLVLAFIVATFAYAVGATSHSLASFRTESLETEFFEDRP